MFHQYIVLVFATCYNAVHNVKLDEKRILVYNTIFSKNVILTMEDLCAHLHRLSALSYKVHIDITLC